MLNPCARESKGENRQFSFGESGFLTTARFRSTRANLEQRTGNIPGAVYEGTRGFGRSGCWLGRRLHSSSRPPPSWTSVHPTVFIFLHNVTFYKRGPTHHQSVTGSFALLPIALDVAGQLQPYIYTLGVKKREICFTVFPRWSES